MLLTFKQANPVRVTSVVSLFCISKYVPILSWVTSGGTCLCSVINGGGYEAMATATGIYKRFYGAVSTGNDSNRVREMSR